MFRRKPTLDIFFLSPAHPPFPLLGECPYIHSLWSKRFPCQPLLDFVKEGNIFLKIFGSTHHSLWVQNLRISLPWHPPSGCLFSPFILALLAVPYFLIYMLPSKWHWTENTIWMTTSKQKKDKIQTYISGQQLLCSYCSQMYFHISKISHFWSPCISYFNIL